MLFFEISLLYYDFSIVSDTRMPGLSLIMAQNEDAYEYLVDELGYDLLANGNCPVFDEAIGDFISDAEHAHFCCEYI